jgi:hypothetical protein
VLRRSSFFGSPHVAHRRVALTNWRIGFPPPRPSPPLHVQRSKLRRLLAAMSHFLPKSDVRDMSDHPPIADVRGTKSTVETGQSRK